MRKHHCRVRIRRVRWLAALLSYVHLAAVGESVVDLSLAVPESARAPPFELAAVLHDASAARDARVPESLTIEVFEGSDAECGDELTFNTSEVRLSPTLDHANRWHVPPVKFAVGSAWGAGTYLVCVVVEGEHGLHLASASGTFQVMARKDWTLSASYLGTARPTEKCSIALDLDLGGSTGIQRSDIRELEGARVEMEVDGKIVWGNGRDPVRWGKRRVRVTTWSDMEASIGGWNVRKGAEGQGVVAVRHHACPTCIGATPQDLVRLMAGKNPEIQRVISQFYGESFREVVPCPRLSAPGVASTAPHHAGSQPRDEQGMGGGDGADEGDRGGPERGRAAEGSRGSASDARDGTPIGKAAPTCFGNFSGANVVEALGSEATLLVLGCLHASCGAGSGVAVGEEEVTAAEEEEGNGAAHPRDETTAGVGRGDGHGLARQRGAPKLVVAGFIARDVAAFLQLLRRGGSRPNSSRQKTARVMGGGARTLCVSLIGLRDAPGESSARAGLHTSWAAEASRMIRSIRELERTSGSFGGVYVVGDAAFPEEEQALVSQLGATAYQGILTARRLGTRIALLGDETSGDVLWVRDLQVCSSVDVYLSNDVASLHECGLWSRAVRARRARLGLPSYDYFGRLMPSTAANGWGCPYAEEEAPSDVGDDGGLGAAASSDVCGWEDEDEADVGMGGGEAEGRARKTAAAAGAPGHEGEGEGAAQVGAEDVTRQQEEEKETGAEGCDDTGGDEQRDLEATGRTSGELGGAGGDRGRQPGEANEDCREDVWVEEGRRPAEFVGDMFRQELALCSRPRLYGAGVCADGGKVLCETPRLHERYLAVSSFSVAFVFRFHRERIRSSQGVSQMCVCVCVYIYILRIGIKYAV